MAALEAAAFWPVDINSAIYFNKKTFKSNEIINLV